MFDWQQHPTSRGPQVVVFRADAYGLTCITAVRNQLVVESKIYLRSTKVGPQLEQLRIAQRERQKNEQT